MSSEVISKFGIPGFYISSESENEKNVTHFTFHCTVKQEITVTDESIADETYYEKTLEYGMVQYLKNLRQKITETLGDGND